LRKKTVSAYHQRVTTKRDGPITLWIKATVPVPARRYIALQYPDRAHTARKHLAKRETIQQYVQTRLLKLCELIPFEADPRHSQVEQEESRLAVEELRRQGWADAKIHAWILLQQARLAGLRATKPKEKR
jgi:hypothetical protein